jgi:NAD(P)H-hydrate epimerase
MPTGGDEPSGAHRHDPPPKTEGDVYILSRQAAREIDRLAAAEYRIPSILLMENAAFHLADIALAMVAEAPGATILIVCGPGNNGGDGLAVARHLHNAHASVHIVLGAPESAYTGDAAANLAICRAMQLPITQADPANPAAAFDRAERALTDAAGGEGGEGGGADHPDLIIDALLGTGLASDVRPPLAALIESINARARNGTPVLSADIPSGLDADTGQVRGVAVHATITVTFAGLKQGFTTLAAQPFIGDVVVADIGAPRELTQRLGRLLSDHDLPARRTPTPEEPDEPTPARPGPE